MERNLSKIDRRKFLKLGLKSGVALLSLSAGCVEAESSQDFKIPENSINPKPITPQTKHETPQLLTKEEQAKQNFERAIDWLDARGNFNIQKHIGSFRLLQAELENPLSRKIRLIDNGVLSTMPASVSLLATENGTIPIIVISTPEFSAPEFNPQTYGQELLYAYLIYLKATQDPGAFRNDSAFNERIRQEAANETRIALQPVY